MYMTTARTPPGYDRVVERKHQLYTNQYKLGRNSCKSLMQQEFKSCEHSTKTDVVQQVLQFENVPGAEALSDVRSVRVVRSGLPRRLVACAQGVDQPRWVVKNSTDSVVHVARQ